MSLLVWRSSLTPTLTPIPTLTLTGRAGLINMHIRVRVAYGAIGVTYLIVILSILFGCHPMHKNWQIYPNPGRRCHSLEKVASTDVLVRCQPAIAPLDVYMTVTLNVATDIYLITIPTPVRSFSYISSRPSHIHRCSSKRDFPGARNSNSSSSSLVESSSWRPGSSAAF